MMRFARSFCAAVALLASAASSFGQTSLQGGPGSPGHAPMYSGQGSPVILQDSGPAGGGRPGVGLSEIGVTARGTGTPPYATQGSGPLGTLGCFYDAPITNVAGYHYLCFSPNAQGGPLIAYGAAGGASPLGLQIGMNGVVVPFSTATGGIVVGATPIGAGTSGAILYNNAGILGNAVAAGDCTTTFSTTINFSCTKTNGTAFGALATTVAGTGVAAAAAINVGTAGALVVNGGGLGTPSSGVATNLIGTAAGLTAGNVTTNANLTGAVTSAGNATSLGSFSSANLRGALTDETGTGVAYFQGGDIGTPSAGVGTNLTALNASNLGSGTVAAARGGAGTINGVLSGNGSGTVAQGATTGLSDVSTGAVTPTDNSGAALAFTSVSAKYDKIGDVIHVFLSFVYPSTASGASASVSLAGLPANFPAAAYGRQCTITISNGATPAVWALPTASSAIVAFFTSTGAAVTNVNLSASNMIFSCIYPAT